MYIVVVHKLINDDALFDIVITPQELVIWLIFVQIGIIHLQINHSYVQHQNLKELKMKNALINLVNHHVLGHI